VVRGRGDVPSSRPGIPAAQGGGEDTADIEFPAQAGAGVFDRVHQTVLDRLGEQGELDWSRAPLDSVSVRAKRG
jgi:hypothetical protein